MTLVYAVRHADYENPEGIIPGRMLTSPLGNKFGLNDLGREQAQKLADYFSDRGISFVYSSPMLRSQQTAEAVAGRAGLEVRTDERLADVRSPLDGTLFSEFEGNAYRDRRHLDGNGETIGEVAQRMTEFLGYVLLLNEENIVFVSHGDPIEFLRRTLESGTPNISWGEKTSDYIARGDAYRLEFEGRKFVRSERLYIQEERVVCNSNFEKPPDPEKKK